MKLSDLKCPNCEGQMTVEQVDCCLYAKCYRCEMGFLLDAEAEGTILHPGMELSEAARKRYEAEKRGVAYRTEIRDWKKNAKVAKKKQDEAYENRAELLEEYRAKRLKEERPGKEVQSTVVIIGAMVFLLLIMACCCGVGSMYGEEILEFLEKYYSDLYHLIFP